MRIMKHENTGTTGNTGTTHTLVTLVVLRRPLQAVGRHVHTVEICGPCRKLPTQVTTFIGSTLNYLVTL